MDEPEKGKNSDQLKTEIEKSKYSLYQLVVNIEKILAGKSKKYNHHAMETT